jgi:hypothetical protein
MNYIKILIFILITFPLSNCNNDSGPFTTIDEPSQERLEQLAYHYGKWEVDYKTLVYKDLIATDTLKRHFYLDFQSDGYALQTSIDRSLKENFYWNLSQNANEMVICVDIAPINADEFLGCSTYKIMNQTDSIQQWQLAYYAIQGIDTTLYVREWELIRQ